MFGLGSCTIQEMSEDRKNSALQQLQHAKSDKRRSAAKTLLKLKDPAAGPGLLEALRRELLDPRTWETQYYMIMAIGVCGHREAFPLMQELAATEIRHSAVYLAVGDALARLAGAALDQTLSEVMQSKKLLLVEGAFRAVSEAALKPRPEIVENMVTYVRSLPLTDERGVWPRIWLAESSTVLDSPAVRGLLEELKDTDIDKLKMAIEAAAKGKRVNFGPL